MKDVVSQYERILQTLVGGTLPAAEDVGLPVQNKTELDSLEERLSDSEEFKKLVTFLGAVGGRDAADCSRRVMSKVLANSLAVTLNWQGSTKKTSIQLYPKVIQLMAAGVRQQKLFAELSQRNFEDNLKQWLRNAGDRDGGRLKRQRINIAANK